MQGQHGLGHSGCRGALGAAKMKFKRKTQPRWAMVGSVAVVGLLVVTVLFCMSTDQPKPPQLLRINHRRISDVPLPSTVQRTNIVLDDLRQKYSPERREEFYVGSIQDTAIFILATGVQVRTPAGWQTAYEEYRGEIWRLKSGVAREVCVERPESGVWRVYVRYGTEMRGPSLVKAQLKDAWISRSFSNWTGKAWGGGRWSGSNELFSDEVTE